MRFVDRHARTLAERYETGSTLTLEDTRKLFWLASKGSGPAGYCLVGRYTVGEDERAFRWKVVREGWHARGVFTYWTDSKADGIPAMNLAGLPDYNALNRNAPKFRPSR